ncbi:glycoside hydrolase family 132 protein [Aplosporella prunicola CBS 121167]|uniref:Glycoside hydrolase family 132 protein n=1 Tax=Aplosporella prunicola CBS 121167 TaxID=1176127 RepID=A0A6A6BCJ8_9PEZI|nr:glycoside hydrolase family 132 protein [Aplosporella prunicola CBS 121167]KAF2140617.1 glycoside hydrolase family 132 protein [Aplosporella prunicola CBS 121167]
MTGAKSTTISSVHSISEASKSSTGKVTSTSVSTTTGKGSSLPKTSSASETYGVPSGKPTSTVPTAKGLDKDFPDNVPCTEFPSDYGAIPVEYMNLGGWIGVQVPNIATAAGFDDIETMVSNLCDGEDCCVEGAFCSYACPPGYQKSQWPKTQGTTGQSIGGIQCRSGMLRLTNPDEKRLCIPGAKEVNIQVENKLNGSVAICRTDYPGTEGMTIPLETYPGDVAPLTCPDQKTYYQWQGKSTSGQYYVNNLNVPAFDACQWSDGEEPIGNWAPLNLGVGYANGAAYLAIFQNRPTTYSRLGFSVEIVAKHMSGKCKYSHGKYCKGDDYQDCNDNDGCTVAVSSGNATFVLSYD